MPKQIEHSDVPTREEFKAWTIRLMRDGVTNSRKMREIIAQERELEVDWDTGGRWNANPSGTFINTHAFALVQLQSEGLIEKIGVEEYQLKS